jgi:tRNA modification GTPase
MNFFSDDTIAAPATAMGASGIGIVRMSGKDSMRIMSEIFQPKNQKKNMMETDSHTIHYGHIYDEKEMVDEVLVMVMKSPNTYTGEDTVEIDCHGGVLAVKKVLETAVKHGARPAQPGEFTKRAFLNGKMDLSKAEAVMDVIHAKNEYALKSSLSQLKGSLENEIKSIRENLIYHVAFIESALDDPEHISIDGYGENLREAVEKEEKRIEKLINSFDEGKLIQEGIKTVIVGKPNAGKSSLLNVLVREDKAIVTDIAGTTRDVLEENIMLHGISLKIIDTAGIRKTEDIVEKIGVEKARQYAKDADLILYVADSSKPLDENDVEIINLIKHEEKKAIVLLNKSDLEGRITLNDIREKIDVPVIEISALEETGIDELENCMKEIFFQGDVSFNDEVYITNIRHKTALEEAKKSLDLVKRSIEDGMPEDFFSIDLLGAYEALGSITGESLGEDLVNEIFSKFCTGK